MENFRIIPRLEVKSGNLIKGMRMEGLRIVGDPVEFAQMYYEDGADEIIYDDIVASLYSRLYDLEIISKISKNIHIPLTVSGGIRSINDIHKIFDAGADKICINTNAFKNPSLIYEAAKIYGSQCISICIQGKKIFEENWEPFTESGRNRMFVDLIEWLSEVQNQGCGEIVFISIDHDGINKGLDFDIIKRLRQNCNVPLLVGGGIHSKNDVETLIDNNINGAIISRMFHLENRTIKDLKRSLSVHRKLIRIES
tara:strand:- start:958 stop:1719 length:762 start_codon:yes stop_codon:yes gene_type:complete